MTLIYDLIEKRKKIYSVNPEKDARFVQYSANKILGDKESIIAVKQRPWLLIEALLTIVDKKRNTVPFFLNTVQKEFLKTFEERRTEKPYFILKGRQQGFTTLITAMQLCYAITRRNFSGFTVADCADNVNAIFNDKAKVVYNALPKVMKPHEKYNTRKELFFDKLNSSWRISTAGDGAGRSRTLEFAHFSEVAFYDVSLSNMQKGIGEALTQNAVVIYETTANGWNEAKDLWDSESCINLFFEWWKTDDYRLDKALDYRSITDKWLLERIDWLKNKKGLDDNQIAWYVNKYNGYLDKKSIRQEYPCTSEEAFISSGECEFDQEKVVARLNELSVSSVKFDYTYRAIRGDYCTVISDIKESESPSGKIERFYESRPSERYVIGCDTAGTGDDYFTAVVERVSDAKTVAVYRVKNIDEDLYARQLHCLGKYYNDAVIAVEVNFSTTPVRELVETDYPEIYRRADGLDGLGFKTTSITRPLVINGLKSAFREDPSIETSREILLEMLSFVRNKNGRAEAVVGQHDDLVMAKAIAHYVRDQIAIRYSEHEESDFLRKNFNFTTNRNNNTDR